MPTHFPSAPLRLVARARSPSQTPRVVRLGDAGYGPWPLISWWSKSSPVRLSEVAKDRMGWRKQLRPHPTDEQELVEISPVFHDEAISQADRTILSRLITHSPSLSMMPRVDRSSTSVCRTASEIAMAACRSFMRTRVAFGWSSQRILTTRAWSESSSIVAASTSDLNPCNAERSEEMISPVVHRWIAASVNAGTAPNTISRQLTIQLRNLMDRTRAPLP
jgi:hypothetical protein